MNNQNQTRFRNLILARDRHCIITGKDVSNSQAAHIIPQYVCEGLDIYPSENNPRYNPDNGLLLRNDIHSSFDLYQWTFDPFSLTEQQGNFYLEVITNNPDIKISINEHIFTKQGLKAIYRVPRECLPYIFVRYRVWLQINLMTQYGHKRTSEIERYLYNKAFEQLLKDSNGDLTNFIYILKTLIEHPEHNRGLILAYNPVLENYLVLFWGKKWSDSFWISRNYLAQKVCQKYHDLIS